MDVPFEVPIGPAKWLSISIVELDIVLDAMQEIRDRNKDATLDAIAGDQTQPDFHLVRPGGVGGRKIKVHMGCCSSQARNSGLLCTTRLSKITGMVLRHSPVIVWFKNSTSCSLVFGESSAREPSRCAPPARRTG
jgi:hypothetical protein